MDIKIWIEILELIKKELTHIQFTETMGFLFFTFWLCVNMFHTFKVTIHLAPTEIQQIISKRERERERERENAFNDIEELQCSSVFRGYSLFFLNGFFRMVNC